MGQVSHVRIENNARVGNVAGRSAAGRSSSGVPFEIGQGAQAQEARPTATVAAAHSLDALLAMQAIEDPLLKRKKIVRRGNQLIDTLEGLRGDLLVGRMAEGRLNQLMAVLTQARERSDPGLDALLDDIELRARVELAKRGLYLA
jgi:hypothetical protein